MLINDANLPATLFSYITIIIIIVIIIIVIIFVILYTFPKSVKIYVCIMETQCDFC
jgi:uncharacterized protein YpmB